MDGSLRVLEGKTVDHPMLVDFTGAEDGMGKGRLIGRVRKIFCFQAKARTVSIDDAVFAADGAVEKVSGVELDRRLVGPQFHATPR